MCLSWAGASGTSILEEVAPELNLERQACLASQASEAKNTPAKSKGKTGMRAYGALGNCKWIGTANGLDLGGSRRVWEP